MSPAVHVVSAAALLEIICLEACPECGQRWLLRSPSELGDLRWAACVGPNWQRCGRCEAEWQADPDEFKARLDSLKEPG